MRAAIAERQAEATAPIARLSGVRKAYASGTVALEALDLVIGQGEFVSLLGPSGCGKTTALRLIAGLASPTRGRIERPDSAEGGIGFVFQEPTLMPWATAFDNVWLPFRLQGRSRAEVRENRHEIARLSMVVDHIVDFAVDTTIDRMDEPIPLAAAWMLKKSGGKDALAFRSEGDVDRIIHSSGHDGLYNTTFGATPKNMRSASLERSCSVPLILLFGKCTLAPVDPAIQTEVRAMQVIGAAG